MGDIATALGVLVGALAAAGVSPPLTRWCGTLAAGDGAATPTRSLRVSSAAWVTTAVAAVLGGTAALLAPSPAWWVLGTGGAALAVVDWRTHRLPARFVRPLAAAIGAVLVVDAAITGQWDGLIRGVLAAALIGTLWFLVAFASPGAVGLGDIRVAALAAGLLGVTGWTAVLYGQLAASILGVLTAAVMIATRHDARSGVPMGPALILGAFVGAMLG